MNSETLLDMAESNLWAAKTLMTARPDDGRSLCHIGYHLEQVVELAIKHFLEEDGVRYDYIHDITQLIKNARETAFLQLPVWYADGGPEL